MIRDVGITVAGLVLLGVVLVYIVPALPERSVPEEELVACTLDAKMCLDGSYVGRVPPSCEFAACPDVSYEPDVPDFTNPRNPSNPPRPIDLEPVACPADAKICPDGTALGRTGPNCEFPACPGE